MKKATVFIIAFILVTHFSMRDSYSQVEGPVIPAIKSTIMKQLVSRELFYESGPLLTNAITKIAMGTYMAGLAGLTERYCAYLSPIVDIDVSNMAYRKAFPALGLGKGTLPQLAPLYNEIALKDFQTLKHVLTEVIAEMYVVIDEITPEIDDALPREITDRDKAAIFLAPVYSLFAMKSAVLKGALKEGLELKQYASGGKNVAPDVLAGYHAMDMLIAYVLDPKNHADVLSSVTPGLYKEENFEAALALIQRSVTAMDPDIYPFIRAMFHNYAKEIGLLVLTSDLKAPGVEGRLKQILENYVRFGLKTRLLDKSDIPDFNKFAAEMPGNLTLGGITAGSTETGL